MQDMLDDFRLLGSSLVSDVLDEAGYHNQTIAPVLGPIGPAQPFCGPAVCVQGERQVSTANSPRSAAIRPLYELPLLVRSGTVLVLSTNGFRGGAVTGGLLAAELAQAGCVGILTDGMVRDRREIAEIGLPVRAAGTIPLNGARRYRLVGWNVLVSMPSPEGGVVTIRPGDLILGDDDGTVVIPQTVAPEILRMSRELQRREQALRDNAAGLSAEERAAARAARMSHVEWLRAVGEVTS